MLKMKNVALIAMAAVVASATVAPAGTKYATNLVSNDAFDPPTPPTLSAKSALKLDDKGTLSVKLAGVVEAGPMLCQGGTNTGAACTNGTECPGGTCVVSGVPVTTSQLYNETKKTSPAVDGSEYVVIIKLVLPAISGFIPVVEVPVPVDLKAGKGGTKISAKDLFALIPPGAGRTVEVVGSEVWGPLGAGNAPACTALISSSLPASLTSPDPTCRGGSQIGMSGIAIPPVAP